MFKLELALSISISCSSEGNSDCRALAMGSSVVIAPVLLLVTFWNYSGIRASPALANELRRTPKSNTSSTLSFLWDVTFKNFLAVSEIMISDSPMISCEKGSISPRSTSLLESMMIMVQEVFLLVSVTFLSLDGRIHLGAKPLMMSPSFNGSSFS